MSDSDIDASLSDIGSPISVSRAEDMLDDLADDCMECDFNLLAGLVTDVCTNCGRRDCVVHTIRRLTDYHVENGNLQHVND